MSKQDKIRRTLRPFARLAAYVPFSASSTEPVIVHIRHMRLPPGFLTVGDLRRAEREYWKLAPRKPK